MRHDRAASAAAARRLLGAAAQPVGGSGRSFVVTAAGERAVLRLYPDDPERAAVDAALLRLVAGILPVPEVLEVRTAGVDERPAFLLRTYLPGETYEGRPAAEVTAVATQVAAALAAVPVARAGDLVDGTLVPVPGPEDGPGPACLDHRGLPARHLLRDSAGGRLVGVLGWDLVRASIRPAGPGGAD